MSVQLRILALLMIILFVAAPVIAQDDDSEAPAPETIVLPLVGADAVVDEGIIDPFAELQEMFAPWVALVDGIANSPWAITFIVLLTALTKLLPMTSKFNPRYISFLWSAVVTVIWIAAGKFGYQGQFEMILPSIATLGTAILGMTVLPIASGKLYDYANSNQIPIIGYSRGTSGLVSLDQQIYSEKPQAFVDDLDTFGNHP